MTHLFSRRRLCLPPLAAVASNTVVALFWSICMAAAQSASAQVGQELRPQRTGNFTFGTDVAIDGNVAAITGFIERNPTFNSEVPTVDVYRYDGATWVFEQHLFSSDAVFYNDMGNSVQVDGDLITVGAAHTGKGAVVTFRYDGSSWIEEDLVQPMSPTSLTDNFGDVTALAGDQLVVPDTQDWDGFVERELVYVFRYDGSVWQMEDTLRAGDAYDGSGFGISASTSVDLVVVGDPYRSVTGTLSREGAVYVFERNPTVWSETQRLSAGADMVPDARFGQSVVTDGTSIIVGAHRDSVGDFFQAGAAYVFQKQATDWSFVQRLAASDAKRQGYFGLDAAVSGTRMIIGAPNDTRPGFINDGGRAYFYTYNGSQWIERTVLAVEDAVSDDRFGWAVDMDETWVIVGAPGRRQDPWRPGAAYIFPVSTLVATDEIADRPTVRPVIQASAYPNPFSQAVTVDYELAAPAHVLLEVYDVLGRRVAVLADEVRPPGRHEADWQAPSDVAPGVYLIRGTTEPAPTESTGATSTVTVMLTRINH